MTIPTTAFTGKIALVTGAGKGLGRAIVAGLVEVDIGRVICVTRSQADLDDLVQEYGSAKILPVCVDLADSGATNAKLDAALADVDMMGPADR
eukprot:g8502.t1